MVWHRMTRQNYHYHCRTNLKKLLSNVILLNLLAAFVRVAIVTALVLSPVPAPTPELLWLQMAD